MELYVHPHTLNPSHMENHFLKEEKGVQHTRKLQNQDLSWGREREGERFEVPDVCESPISGI